MVSAPLLQSSSRRAKTVNLLAKLERQNKPFILLVGFTLIVVIGCIDFLIGYEVGLSVFYVLPIALITWLTSRWFGVAASITSALVWFSADVASRDPYLHPLILVWNTLIRLTFFVIITFLLSALRRAAQRERELAHIDYLTGAGNPRFFYQLAQVEIDRLQRYQHPFTVAYIDLDNLKTVNDRLGHGVGDQVLRAVVRSVKKNIRRTDSVARLGGDEFALLLPETNQESARVALSKIQEDILEEMRINNWAVTVSIGVLTCPVAPPSTDALVSMADELMYSVKRDGKNGVKYSTYAG
jgi:diguanylate cyclase (GGDEF)-like protein